MARIDTPDGEGLEVRRLCQLAPVTGEAVHGSSAGGVRTDSR